MKLVVDGKPFEVTATAEAVAVDGQDFTVRVQRRSEWDTVFVNNRPLQCVVGEAADGDTIVYVDAKSYRVRQEGRSRTAPIAVKAPAAVATANGPLPSGGIAAQMAGRVLRIAVSEGQAVSEGDLLLVIEAMKMENEIRASKAGTVKQIAVAAGDRTQLGELLIVIG